MTQTVGISRVDVTPAHNGWLVTLHCEDYSEAVYVFTALHEALNFIRIRLTGE